MQGGPPAGNIKAELYTGTMATEASTLEPARVASPLRFVGVAFRLLAKLALVLGFICAGLFVGGFLKFSSTISAYDIPKNIETSDAIVVLTGGSSRIAHALDLVQSNKGARLLISGANPNTKADDIQKVNDSRKALFDCCVDLDSQALNTVGNARETRKWADAKGYKSLIVVTSAYHMPRSMLEFRHEMPNHVLRPYPVPLKELKAEGWWKNPETLKFVLSEYTKYVGAGLRDYVRPELYLALRDGVRNG